MLLGLHHIQLAMPEGGEDDARSFYSGVLGLKEVPKPRQLAGRGGVWFGQQTVQVHLGVETPFAPAKKAHPAFRIGSLDDMKERLLRMDIPYTSDIDLPGIRRIFVADPFGNRIELLEAHSRGVTTPHGE